MMNFGKFFKRKIGFTATTSLIVLSSLFYSAAVSAMDVPQDTEGQVRTSIKPTTVLDEEGLPDAPSSDGQAKSPEQKVDESKDTELFDYFAGETPVKTVFVEFN